MGKRSGEGLSNKILKVPKVFSKISTIKGKLIKNLFAKVKFLINGSVVYSKQQEVCYNVNVDTPMYQNRELTI